MPPTSCAPRWPACACASRRRAAGGPTIVTSSCALGTGARRALDRFRAAASRAGVRLVIAEEAPGAVGCCTDAELDRMLDVLIENALAYASDGGTVELAVFPGVIEVR